MNKILFFLFFFSLCLNAQQKNHIDILFDIIQAKKAVDDISVKIKTSFIQKLNIDKVDTLKLYPILEFKFNEFKYDFYNNLQDQYLKKFNPKKIIKLVSKIDKYKNTKAFLKKIDFYKELKIASKLASYNLKASLKKEFEIVGLDESIIFKN